MGCGGSKRRCPEELLEKYLRETPFSVREINDIYARFCDLDEDQDGTLSTDDFLSIQELATNPLVMRVISVFDDNGDDSVDFDSFIKTMAVFHPSTDRETKLLFIFKMYDVQCNEKLYEEEIFQVMKMLVGAGLTEKQLRVISHRVIEECDSNGNGAVDQDEFIQAFEELDVKQLSMKF